jgi:hypothetical protein
MDPITVITGLTQAIALAKQLYDDYEAGKAVLSLQDAQAIKAQLIQAQTITEQLTPLVDAALDAASKK